MSRLNVIIMICLASSLVAAMTWAHPLSLQEAPSPPIPLRGDEGGEGGEGAPRFLAIPLLIDSGDEALAAYQIDFRAIEADVKIVGIEGSAHVAFADPPYYDRAAMQSERVIIADFSTLDADDLPSGQVHIATVHVMVSGDVEPVFETRLDVSANQAGEMIDARVFTEEKDES